MRGSRYLFWFGMLVLLLSACASAPAVTSAPSPAPAPAQPTQAAPTPTPTPAPTPTPSILTAESAEAAFAKQHPDQNPPQVAQIIHAAGVWVAVDDAGQAVMYVDEAHQWQTPEVIETDAGSVAYLLADGQLKVWNPLKLAFQTIALEGKAQSVSGQGASMKVELADGTSRLLQFDEKSRQWEELTIRRFINAKELSVTKEKDRQLIKEAMSHYIAGGVFWDQTESVQHFSNMGFMAYTYEGASILVTPEVVQKIDHKYFDFNSGVSLKILCKSEICKQGEHPLPSSLTTEIRVQ